MIRALLALAAIAGASLAFLALALPQPSAADQVAVRAVERLLHTRVTGGVVRLGGEPLLASCRRRTRTSGIVSLADGRRLLVWNTHVRQLRGGARQTAAASKEALVEAAALGDLVGTHELYADELAARLRGGRDPVAARTTYAGRPAYRLRLADAPRVELYVDRGTLRPLGVRYDSGDLHGTSRLFVAGAGERGC